MAKILFVEEELFTMESFVKRLQDAGHEVTPVLSGEDAIKSLKSGQHDFDLIVLDIMLPRGNHRGSPAVGDDIKTGEMGLEILRQLREEMNDETPVVALTAVMDDDLKTKVLEHGVERYFTKPTALEDFMQTVEAALKPMHSLSAEASNNGE